MLLKAPSLDQQIQRPFQFVRKPELQHPPRSAKLESVILFFNVLTFIYLFWLCWVFVAAQGFSLVAALRLLIAVASLVMENRL